MPITTPKAVNTERALFDNTEEIEIRKFSKNNESI
jgi:hypothetical protein